eukprot:5052468-Lingulodinium_polyedra.AAC.1
MIGDQDSEGRSSGAPASRQPGRIPEHEAVDFDGAAGVATDVIADRIPRAVCKRTFFMSWLCELDIHTKAFH